MVLEDIKTLVLQDMLEDAIKLLVSTSKGYSTGLMTKAEVLLSEYRRLDDDKSLGIDVADDMKKLKKSVLNMLVILGSYTPNGQIVTLSTNKILNPNSYPFIDRKKFREMLKNLLATDGGKLVFVKGEKKSGMSYLENYLNHLSILSDLFSVARINVAEKLDDPNPNKAVNLARLIADGLNMPFNYITTDTDHLKFSAFTTKLKDTFTSEDKIPIVYIHDFHRMQVMPDVNKLILLIADAFRQRFPKAIFIIGGMDYSALENWHTDLKLSSHIYEIEPMEVEHVQECLHEIFDKYQTKIDVILNGISREDYIEGMTAKLISKHPIDVAAVGQGIKDHLYLLQQP